MKIKKFLDMMVLRGDVRTVLVEKHNSHTILVMWDEADLATCDYLDEELNDIGDKKVVNFWVEDGVLVLTV